MNRLALLTLALCAVRPAAADELAIPGDSVTYVVQKGDTLWDLSAKFYSNAWEWPTIWKSNPQIADPHWIYPGNSLTIPTKEGAPVVAAPEPELMPAPVPAPEQAAAPAPAPAPAPVPVVDVVQAPPAIPAISETLSKNLELPKEINEEIPPDLTGGEDSSPKMKAPLDWQPNGVVKSDDWSNAIDGETVGIKFVRNTAVRPGDRLYVVLNAGFGRDPNGKKTNVVLQKIAEIRVTSVQSGREAEGVIERAKDGVQNGHPVVTALP